ncbi:MAG: diguanylate cyclase, partial [Moraxellaceae bacterium]
MQNKNNAVELIKKFQQLFTDLNHKQIAERLVKLVVAKNSISRAVLIVERDSHLYVEAIASQQDSEPFVTGIATSLNRLNYLPHQHIRSVFDSRQVQTLDSEQILRLGAMFTQKGCKSCYLHPITENNKTIAVFYMESEYALVHLTQAVHELDTIWTFSSLLVRQVIDMWHHEEQAERFRLAEQALWASET